jgi:hypothetical protein
MYRGGGTARSIVFGLAVLALSCLRASAADTITITIAPQDSEVITTDLKRIRPAAPADIRFKVTTNYIEQVFGKDLTIPRNLMQLAVLSSARRVLGAMTGAQATGPDAARAVMEQVDRDLARIGVAVEQHTLRYEFIPGYTP